MKKELTTLKVSADDIDEMLAMLMAQEKTPERTRLIHRLLRAEERLLPDDWDYPSDDDLS